MSNINFPSNPQRNQIFRYFRKLFIWNGEAWVNLNHYPNPSQIEIPKSIPLVETMELDYMYNSNTQEWSFSLNGLNANLYYRYINERPIFIIAKRIRSKGYRTKAFGIRSDRRLITFPDQHWLKINDMLDNYSNLNLSNWANQVITDLKEKLRGEIFLNRIYNESGSYFTKFEFGIGFNTANGIEFYGNGYEITAHYDEPTGSVGPYDIELKLANN